MTLPLFYKDDELEKLDRDFLIQILQRLDSKRDVSEYRKRVIHALER